MKQTIFLLLYASIVVACTTLNRIVLMDEDELKSMKLVQSPNAHFIRVTSGMADSSGIQVFTTYLYKENIDTLPAITLGIQFKKQINEALDSVIFINLDNENIRLVSLHPIDSTGENLPLPPVLENKAVIDNNRNLKANQTRGEYLIPENLWLPMAYSQKIFYRLFVGKKEVDIELNRSERNKLIEFFKEAIKKKEEKFPNIPEGQKKW